MTKVENVETAEDKKLRDVVEEVTRSLSDLDLERIIIKYDSTVKTYTFVVKHKSATHLVSVEGEVLCNTEAAILSKQIAGHIRMLQEKPDRGQLTDY